MPATTLFRLSGQALLAALPLQTLGFVLHPPSGHAADVLQLAYEPAHLAFINNGTNLYTTSAFDLSFDSGAVPSGKAWVIAFDKPGTYRYFCRQHFLNGMAGLVTVQ